jgi:hypothetical protein
MTTALIILLVLWPIGLAVGFARQLQRLDAKRQRRRRERGQTDQPERPRRRWGEYTRGTRWHRMRIQ